MQGPHSDIRGEMRAAFRGEPLGVALYVSIVAALGTLMFSIAIAQTAVLVAILLWFWRLARGRRCALRGNPLMLPYTLFILARIAAIPLSIDPSVSVTAFQTEIPFYLFFYVVFCELEARSTERLRFIVHLLVAAAVVAVIAGFVRYALGMDARLTSTTAGYYTLGMFLAAVFALTFALGRRRELFPNRIVWLLLCLVMLVGLLFTFNRMHWVVAGLAAIIVGAIRERRILLVLAVAGIAAVAALDPLRERFLQLLDAGAHMSGRDVIWRGAMMLVDERPIFGFGLKTFHQVFPLFDQAPDKGIGSWHNDYLQVYMDSGIVALLPFVAILAAVFFMGWKNHRAWPAGSLQRALNAALLLMIGCFAVAGGMLDSLLSILFRTSIAVVAVLYSARPSAVSDATGRTGGVPSRSKTKHTRTSGGQ